MFTNTETVVVALGGSIVHPDEIDIAFLKKFKAFIAPFLRRKVKFVLVVGGGNLARRFQNAAGKVATVTTDDKDWIGIHATRLNAHLLRTIFRAVADPVIIDERHKMNRLTHPITMASGMVHRLCRRSARARSLHGGVCGRRQARVRLRQESR
jgi:uridylate kinase